MPKGRPAFRGPDASYEDGVFDAMLDEHQRREREMAAELEAQGDIEARRPQAKLAERTFAEVREGDFITNEPEAGPDARFVEVVKVEQRRKFNREDDGSWLTITFRTPQPIGVAFTDSWVIERRAIDSAYIDLGARDE